MGERTSELQILRRPLWTLDFGLHYRMAFSIRWQVSCTLQSRNLQVCQSPNGDLMMLGVP